MRSAPAVAAALAVAGAAAPAHASLMWNFSFSDGANTASGLLTTDDLSGGSYAVTGITGLFDGVSITGLAPEGTILHGNDNLLFAGPDFYVDENGLGFTLASGGPEVIYAAEGGGQYFAYSDQTGAGGFGSFTASQVQAVPEPATLGLFGAALASLAIVRRRRRT